ncbi:amidase family protein [Halomonas stenophila]|uniref:Mandelamide amidase n=1 Tax=Halomonas stenophila TaxID=795312 RepID=A0A7W5HMA0_9GAMM|nr:amidase family protein [Halomonas stenophila]MBB3232571.1 mandelamide amidase [Halomonas stenophila]
MQPSDLTLKQAVERLRCGELGAEEYAEDLLARCETARPLNAYVSLDGDRVLDAARALDRRERSRGPLGGIPLCVKDAIDIEGTATTAATPSLERNHPGRTASAIERLFDADAVLMGKTNLPELCFHVTCDNAHTGPTRNPVKPEYTAGGSSGGTAAAVAAHTVPAGVGTDTAGSVRIPAAFCGLSGFRPSLGRYPTDGVLPMNASRDTIGLMARTTRDIAFLDAILTGEAEVGPAPLEGLRLGVPMDQFFVELDDQIAAVMEDALLHLRHLGVDLVEVDAPDFAAARAETSGPTMRVEFPRDLARYLDEVGSDLTAGDVVSQIASPYVKAEVEPLVCGAGGAAAAEYARVRSEVLPRHRAAYQAYLEENGLAGMVYPTTPLMPAPIGETEKVTVNGKEVSIWQTLRHTVTAAVLGVPALSVPAGTTPRGLPVGLEFAGAGQADRTVLALGLAWETG